MLVLHVLISIPFSTDFQHQCVPKSEVRKMGKKNVDFSLHLQLGLINLEG